jgi:hypothetical protein
MADKKALVDSGATNNFIHPRFAERMRLGTKKLTQPRKIWNIDGTQNKGGLLTEYIDLNVQTKHIHKEMRFLVTDLGGEDIILGYPWLSTFEPQITWRTATINVSALPIVIRTVNPCIERIAPVIARAMSQIEAAKIVQQLLDTTTIRTTATDLAIAARKDAPTITLPLEYQRHACIFSDEEAQRFPPSRPWDHAINLKPDTPDTINCKVYPLAPARKLALRKWIDEEEAKGYIRKSQSPIMSSWFEIAKKTGDPRPVQDYRIINKHTIKDNAPLPNMKEDIAALANVFIFTTFNIRWGYNNVCIKDGDQWKAAFKTCFGVYEPMVMYFGLTNSPAMFQTMMNHIFCPLIDRHALLGTTIRVYMDDIIVGTSSSIANHTAAVHDVLDLLAEHDLFVKLSKCRFHIASVNYLGVILEEGVTRMDPIKNCRYQRLAYSKESQGRSLFLRLLQFLSLFYPWFRSSCTSSEPPHPKRCHLAMG